MNQECFLKNLTVPKGKIDVILDTDAYNEIDDQFAICYMLKYSHRFNVKGICAAPFFNNKVKSVEEGMLKSYDEILHLFSLMGNEELKQIVYKGSRHYMPDEATPVESEAADFMARLSDNYSPQNPLYIVAIGAITNVSSAILKNPKMKENCVVVWLGGHALDVPFPASEFNMKQDIAGARVLFGCGIPLVLLPCKGVVDRFATSKYELLHLLKGKNALCDYLCDNTIKYVEELTERKTWSKPIWDVTAVAWLLNEDSIFMKDRLIPSPIPEYDKHYAYNSDRHFIRYVYNINRDVLFEDLFKVLGEQNEDI